MKKIVLLLLILIVGIKIKADNGPRPVQIDEIFYRLNSDKTATVVSDDSLDYNLAIVVIPNTVTYDDTKYTVTEIGDYAFYNNSSLLSVKIPNSVTNIGGKAFYGCTNLKNITIPNCVTYIGASAFEDTEWFDNQQDGIVYAGHVAYSYKGTMPSDTEIILKKGTIGIAGSFCENRSNLISVDIPNSVTVIGSDAFYKCSGLLSVDIPNSVTTIGSNVFYGCSGLLSVNISNNVKTIMAGTFNGCVNLKNITIPNGVMTIESNAFNGCTNLKNITIPNSVTYIGASAFEDTEWFDNQQDGVIYAGLVAYRYKGTMATNTNIILKEGTISVSPDFCNGRPLKYVYIPEGVKTIGSFAFSLCDDLTCISIPESVCRLEENWARNSGIKDLFIYSKKPPFVSYYGDISGKLKGMKACVLHVPVESEFLYKEDNSWNNSFKLIETFSTSHRIKEDISEDGVVDTQDILQIYDYMRTR